MKLLKNIQEFVGKKHLAIVGVSRQKDKFSNTVYKELLNKDYILYPVNPNLDEYNGQVCYKMITDLPPQVEGLILLTPKTETLNCIRQAAQKGITQIWIQQGAETEEAITIATEMKMNVIYKECIIMYAEPVSFLHKIHRGINKLIGIYPK